MARKKQLRFAELAEMANVIHGRHCALDWFDKTFGREGAIVLELGCGHGDHTIALARSRPHTGVLGVDRNGARLWKGAVQAIDEGLTNAMFLRSPIEQLEEHIPAGRVSEIWLPFPDPLPKNRQAKHRLASPLFLARYRRLLFPGGVVHLKTDDADLVAFAERAVRAIGGRLRESSDSRAGDPPMETVVQSTYEKRYRCAGRTIYTRSFCLE